mgnify:CR=1 FL=1
MIRTAPSKYAWITASLLLSSLTALPAQPVPPNYVRLEGSVSSMDPGLESEAYHLDAYRISEGGKRKLVRTNRFSTPAYHLYLEANAAYEIVINRYGHAPFSAKLTPELLRPARGQVLQQDWQLQPLQPAAAAPPTPAAPPVSPMAVSELTEDFVEAAGPAVPRLAPPASEVPPEAASGLPAVALAGLPKARHDGQPTDPAFFKSAVRTELPPTPRQERLRMEAKMIAGLYGEAQGEVIARLPAGQALQVIEYTTPEWWMAAHGALIGWVRASSFE